MYTPTTRTCVLYLYTGCARKTSRAGDGRGDGSTQEEEPNETGGGNGKSRLGYGGAGDRIRAGRGEGERGSAHVRIPLKRGVADGGAGARAAERSSPTAVSAHQTTVRPPPRACLFCVHSVLARAHGARTAFASSASRVVRRSRAFPARRRISPDVDSLRSSRFEYLQRDFTAE